MKRLIGLLSCALALLLSLPAVAAEIPEAAKVLTQPQWDGYRAVESSAFWGNAQFGGQIAVVMKKGDHNVLVILERAAGESEYAITVETDRALYQGDRIPDLLIDTNGDALFYTYRYDGGPVSAEMYTAFKTEAGWGPVGMFVFHPEENGRFPESSLFTEPGALYHRMYWSDGNGNVLAQGEAYAMPKDTRAYALSLFDIETVLPDLSAFLAFESSENSRLWHTAEIAAGQGMPAYTLEIWGDERGADGLPQIKRIIVKSGGEIVQQLPAGQPALLDEGGALSPGSLEIGDVNFDGHADFCVLRSPGTPNAYFDYWLFSPNDGAFLKSDLFSALEANPVFDAGQKRVFCSAKDGAADYYGFVYAVQNGDPVLTESTHTHYESANKVKKALWQLVDGEIKLVREWTETP